VRAARLLRQGKRHPTIWAWVAADSRTVAGPRDA
jgi:hypothetical protein